MLPTRYRRVEREHGGRRMPDDVIDWLLDGDPAIRWQVMRDLTDAPPEVVAAERARVAHRGLGCAAARAPGRRRPLGRLALVRPSGTDHAGRAAICCATSGSIPRAPQARRAIDARPASTAAWAGNALERQPFFDGEVEPCINGRIVAIGAYFGEDVDGRSSSGCSASRWPDGGWNCEPENGSTRVLVRHDDRRPRGPARARAGRPAARRRLPAARRRGEEYLLERRLFRRKSTGEVIDPDFTRLLVPAATGTTTCSAALDHLRAAGATPDARMAEAIDLVEQRGAGRPLAARERPSRQGPLRARRRGGQAQPLEHATGAAGPPLGESRRAFVIGWLTVPS